MRRLSRLISLALLIPLAAYAGLISIGGNGRAPAAGGGGGGGSSTLAVLAAATTAGTWARWTDGDVTATDVNPGGTSDPVVSNGYRAMWDTANKKFYYYGHGHAGRLSRFLIFDDATSTWTSNNTDIPLAEGAADAHQWNGFTGNSSGYLFFYSASGSSTWKQQSPGATSWTAATTVPNGGHGAIFGAAFNPNVGTSGALVIASSYGVYIYDKSAATWSTNWDWSGEGHGTDPSGDPPLTDQAVAFFDPRSNAVFAGGGGTHSMIKIATSGAHSVVSDFPSTVAPNFGSSSASAAQMADGYLSTLAATNGRTRRPILFEPGSNMWSYDGVGDSWTSIGTTPPAWMNANNGGFYAVVPDYDGIVWWVQTGGDGYMSAYFFKHTAADES